MEQLRNTYFRGNGKTNVQIYLANSILLMNDHFGVYDIQVAYTQSEILHSFSRDRNWLGSLESFLSH